jgi:dienelactone hydrolase
MLGAHPVSPVVDDPRMAEVVLLHHAQGLTPGCVAFADQLRAGGHAVHTPDLYDGRTFTTLPEGMAYAEEIGFGAIIERGEAAAASRGTDLVYAGFSLGVMPAQKLAQTRAGARAAVFMHAAVPPHHFGGPWPESVPLQIHVMENDELGDVDVARSFESAELFLYPGDGHLFTDSTLADYDADATALVLERVLGLLY